MRQLHPTLGAAMVTTGLDPAFERAYVEHYFRVDPHLALVASLAPGRALLSREILPDSELFATEFFNDFCRPQGLSDVQGAVLVRDSERMVTFASFGPATRRFDAASRARLDSVLPHLTNAFCLAQRSSAQMALRGAARAQQAGLLLLSATLQVLDASADLRRWLEDAGGRLAIRDGSLRLADPRDAEALRAAVVAVLAGTPVTLQLQGGGMPAATFSIVPASPSTLCPERCVLVFFSVHGAAPGSDGHQPLPPALRAVAEALALGLSDKEIAEQLDKPLATVRTYVTRVFRRLNVSNRRELVARHGSRRS